MSKSSRRVVGWTLAGIFACFLVMVIAGTLLLPKLIDHISIGFPLFSMPGLVSDSEIGGTPEKDLPVPDPDNRSEPADPWSIEPVPVDHVVLFLPLNDGDVYTEKGEEIMEILQSQFSLAMPRNVALIPRSSVGNLLDRFSPYQTGRLQVNEDVALGMIEFTGATHILSGKIEENNGEWIIDAVYQYGLDKMDTQIRVPANEDFTAAARLGEGMGEQWDSTLELPPDTVELITTLPYGPKVKSTDSDMYFAMRGDPNHAEWDNLPQSSPANRLYEYYRLDAALMAYDEEMVDALDPGPLEPDAPLIDHVMRRYIFQEREDRGGLRHEHDLILARYPGWSNAIISVIYAQFEEGEMRKDWITIVENWFDRAPHMPYFKAFMGDAYQKCAWDYRISGTPQYLSPQATEAFYDYMGKAEQHLADAAREGRYEPYTCSQLYTVRDALDDEQGAMDAHVESITRWPDAADTYYPLLYSYHPQRGGDFDQLMDQMDKFMQDHPGNGHFGVMAPYCHDYEAQSEYPNLDEIKALKRYCETFTNRWQQMERGFDCLASPKVRDTDTAIGLMVAAKLENKDVCRRLVEHHPSVHNHFDRVGQSDWSGGANKMAAYGYLYHGHWEALLDLCRKVAPLDAGLRRAKPSDGRIAFKDADAATLLHGMAEVMAGNREKGLEMVAPYEARKDMIPSVAYVRIVTDNHSREDIESLEGLLQEKPDASELEFLLAMAYKLQGEEEKAMKYLNQAFAHIDPEDHWPALESDAKEIVMGTVNAEISTPAAP